LVLTELEDGSSREAIGSLAVTEVVSNSSTVVERDLATRVGLAARLAADTLDALAAAELDEGSSIDGVADREFAARVILEFFPEFEEVSAWSTIVLDIRTTARLTDMLAGFSSLGVSASSTIVLRLVLGRGLSSDASALLFSTDLGFFAFFNLTGFSALAVSVSSV